MHPNLAVLIVNTLERGEETAAPLLCRALALLTPPRVAALCRDLLRSAGELMTVSCALLWILDHSAVTVTIADTVIGL